MEVDPGRVASAGLECGGDEAHAFYAVFHVGHEQRRERWAAAVAARVNLLGEVGVELREGFQVSLWVAGRNAAGVCCGRVSSGSWTANDFRSFAELCELQSIRFFLVPIQTGFFAVDAQTQIVSISRGHLAGP